MATNVHDLLVGALVAAWDPTVPVAGRHAVDHRGAVTIEFKVRPRTGRMARSSLRSWFRLGCRQAWRQPEQARATAAVLNPYALCDH